MPSYSSRIIDSSDRFVGTELPCTSPWNGVVNGTRTTALGSLPCFVPVFLSSDLREFDGYGSWIELGCNPGASELHAACLSSYGGCWIKQDH